MQDTGESERKNERTNERTTPKSNRRSKSSGTTTTRAAGPVASAASQHCGSGITVAMEYCRVVSIAKQSTCKLRTTVKQ